MRKANKYIKDKSNTETYIKLSDAHKEFSAWCNIHKEELKNLDEIGIKHFHYFINLLPSIELEKE